MALSVVMSIHLRYLCGIVLCFGNFEKQLINNNHCTSSVSVRQKLHANSVSSFVANAPRDQFKTQKFELE